MHEGILESHIKIQTFEVVQILGAYSTKIDFFFLISDVTWNSDTFLKERSSPLILNFSIKI